MNDVKDEFGRLEHSYSNQQRVYTYKNQRLVTTHKPDYAKLGKSFVQLGNDDWHKASQELTYTAFKLWMYLMENKNGFKWALSQVAVEHTLGIKERAYHKAKDELLTKGYLVEGTDDMGFKPTEALSSPGLDIDWANRTYQMKPGEYEPYYAPNPEDKDEFKPRDW